jgi:hypothetical protein
MQKRIWLSAPFVALAFMALVATRSEGSRDTKLKANVIFFY